MNTRTTSKKYANQFLSACAATLLVSAVAGTATAMTEPPSNTRHAQTEARNMNSLQFVSSSDLLDADIMSSTQETVGSVKDLILERESGRIVFAIVSRGGVMGIGDEEFAIRFGRLSYVPETNSVEGSGGLQTDMTPEQAERQIEFLPKEWNNLSKTSWMNQIPGFESDAKSKRSMDLNESEFAKADTMTVEGSITHVERQKTSSGEDIVVHVQGEDGMQRAVVLGPSWYIMGLDNTPKPGDQTKIEAVKYHDALIGKSARFNETSCVLRDANGKPQWDSTEQATPRYIRLTDLIGQGVQIHGTTGGEVQNAIVEMRSGQIGFIGFDPNNNLLGLGDTITLVPWGALSVKSDASVWSNAREGQFEQAEPIPERIEDLNTRSTAARAYKAFGYELPAFKPQANGVSMHDRAGDPWGHESWLVKQFADGKKVKITGIYRGTEEIKLHEGKASATAVSVDVDGETRSVILGPNWFVQNQPFTLKSGDKITVTGRSAMVDNKEMIAAWKIERGGESMTLWNDTTPAWVNAKD